MTNLHLRGSAWEASLCTEKAELTAKQNVMAWLGGDSTKLKSTDLF